jgi:hypothetical protein
MDILISEEQADRVRSALSGFRYSAMVHSPRHIDSGESLVQWLAAFSEVLASAADDANQKAQKLTDIQNDLESAGRIFGLMQIPVSQDV